MVNTELTRADLKHLMVSKQHQGWKFPSLETGSFVQVGNQIFVCLPPTKEERLFADIVL